ncbi:MAG: polysaccharide pyruvyl transferase family protein [Planctomycetes bacterium]|nr:polysaccharide pyruvyl transferase family protein [Planctomycetota bacterium]
MTQPPQESNAGRHEVRLLLCGACLTGNMGGPALYLTMAQTARRLDENIRITILSKYPNEEEEICRTLGWQMFRFPTYVQMFLGVPFSAVAGLLRRFHLPHRWLARGPFRPYATHDVLVDLSGISFTDDRPVSGLVINSLWLLPATATGIPFVKASQAMGPFTKPWVRWAGRWLLDRAAVLVARGPRSASLVRALLPHRTVHELPDVAFGLEPAPPDEVDRALETAGLAPGDPYCVVGPNYLVESLMRPKHGPDGYARLMAEGGDILARLSGQPVLLVPHARSVSTTPGLDDVHVCHRIRSLSEQPERIHILEDAFGAPVLKGIIARGTVALGSRFHMLVAALSSGVPTAALGWSHKYVEMMSLLGQDRFALNWEKAETASFHSLIHRLWAEREAVRREIAERLPEVHRQAVENVRLVLKTAAASHKGGHTVFSRDIS